MTLLSIFNAYVADSELKNRVGGAMVTAVSDIKEEDPGTANHANRLIWADQVVADPNNKLDELWALVLQDPAALDAVDTGAAVTDTQVQNLVNSLINTLATG